MLRACQRNDWAAFDLLLSSASPLYASTNEANTSPLPSPYSVLPDHPLFAAPYPPPRINAGGRPYWSRDDKLQVLTLWRAWKKFVRHRARLRRNVLWMLVRRSQAWFSKWVKNVAYRTRKRFRVASAIAQVRHSWDQASQRHSWLAWRRTSALEYMSHHHRSMLLRRQLASMWSQWLAYNLNTQRKWIRHHMSMHLFKSRMWRRWKHGLRLRAHQHHQVSYMVQWKAKTRLRSWHALASKSRQMEHCLRRWMNQADRDTLWRTWQTWLKHGDRHRRHKHILRRARRLHVQKWWVRWQGGVKAMVIAKQRAAVATQHLVRTVKARTMARWQHHVAAMQAIDVFCQNFHRHAMLVRSWHALEAVLRRRDEQLGHMARFRARQRLVLWSRQTLHTKKRLRRLEHLTRVAWTAVRLHRGWVDWRQTFATRQRVHAVDGIYTDRLVHKLMSYWKEFVSRRQRLRRHITAAHAKRTTRRKRILLRAWKQHVEYKQSQECRVAFLRDRHDVLLKRRVLAALDTYRRWQQRHRDCMQLAERHHDHLQRTRHLPLALFEWKAVLEDAQALQELWMLQYRAIHRKWTRKLVLRLWRHVVMCRKKARSLCSGHLKAHAKSMLRAWRSHTIAQNERRRTLNVLRQDQQQRQLCYAWIEWRNLSARLRAVRVECYDRYLRRRLVGLLACFVTWVKRYRSRKALWQQAVAFRLETLRKMSITAWARWREVYARRQERKEHIVAITRLHDRQTVQRHLRAWRRRTWAAHQVVTYRHLHSMELVHDVWHAWTNYASRQRYVRQILTIQIKAVYRRQLYRGVRQWSAHFGQRQQVEAWQVQMVRMAASRRWYFKWRGLFDHRQKTLQGIHTRRLAVKRRCWLMWKCFVAYHNHEKQAMADAAAWNRQCRQRHAWQQWHCYCVQRTRQSQQHQLAARHHARYCCKAAVAKLRELWYFKTLMLSVHQHVTRQRFLAWVAQARGDKLRRQRASASMEYMQHWHIRRALSCWHSRARSKNALHDRLHVASRRHRRRMLVEVWRAWREVLDLSMLRGYNSTKAGQRRGLWSWLAFVQTKRHDRQLEAVAAKRHRVVVLAEGWRAWRHYHKLCRLSVHLMVQRRAAWFTQWKKAWQAEQHRARGECALVGRSFRGWHAIVRLNLHARVGLCVVLDRLVLASVLRRWRFTTKQRQKVHVAVLKCHRELLRSTFQGWFQAVTVLWLRRYHATRRCRDLARTTLRQWFQATGHARIQRNQRRRVCLAVFVTWFGFTYARQAIATMTSRRHTRWAVVVFWRWKQVAAIGQCIRMAQLQRLRQLWTGWVEFARDRAAQRRAHNQLIRVLEREHLIERSVAFEQTMRVKDELRMERDLMKLVVRGWHRQMMSSKRHFTVPP